MISLDPIAPPPDLTNAFFPTRYEEIVGQQAACEYLRSLTVGRKMRKNVLLHGDVGSGKTSLATIYVRAMLCNATTAHGSPCGECVPCRTPLEKQPRFIHYDVPADGGDAISILSTVDSAKRASSPENFVIVFFDEAQALEQDACQALLGAVERSSQHEAGYDLAFIFATTDPSALSPALKSRLHPLPIQKLELSDARLLLHRVCIGQEVAAESEALNFVVRFAGGHPRNLLNALEVAINWSERRLSREDAKRAFHYHFVDYLEEYFLALAAGDINRQLEILKRWPDPRRTQIAWIRSFLASFFYRTLLRSEFECDVLVDALIRHREEISRRFYDRLKFRTEDEFREFWSELIRAWDSWPVDLGSDGTIALARFSEVARCGNDRREVGKWSVGPPEASASRPTGDLFMGVEDARRVLDGASAFVQSKGCYLNTLLELRPWASDVQAHAEAEAMMDACVDAIMTNSDSWRVQPFYIRVAENSKAGPIAFVALSLPSDIDGNADTRYLGPLLNFIGDLYAPKRRSAPTFARDVTPASLQKHKRHKAIVQSLLGGLSNDLRLGPIPSRRVREELNLGKQRRRPSPWHGAFVKVGGITMDSAPRREAPQPSAENWEIDEFARNTILREKL